MHKRTVFKGVLKFTLKLQSVGNKNFDNSRMHVTNMKKRRRKIFSNSVFVLLFDVEVSLFLISLSPFVQFYSVFW